MAWQRLSVREGQIPVDTPFEGVPPHLSYPLQHWLEGMFGYRGPGGMSKDLMMDVANSIRLPLRPSSRGVFDGVEMQRQIFAICSRDQEVFLDVVDATLHLKRGRKADDLRKVLEVGASAWTVADNNLSLERRVEPTAKLAAQMAMSPQDEASEELRVAWSAAYGREPDPSDAWDHAIKAAEAVLVPLVVPNQAKPQFGHVLGQLKNQGNLWFLELPGQNLHHDVAPLVEMLSLLWPNPDRHANGQGRQPTLEEAQAVVHLAVTIVQWARSGVLKKR